MIWSSKQRVDSRVLERVREFLPDYLLAQIIDLEQNNTFWLKDSPKNLVSKLDYLSCGELAMVKIALDILCGDPCASRVSSVLDLWSVSKDCRAKIVSSLE